MTIAYLDAVHVLRYTRPGSRLHQQSHARVAVPVDIPEIPGTATERVASIPMANHPDHVILLHEGRLIAPVMTTRYPLRTDSLELRDTALVLGRASGPADTIVQGGPTNPDRATLDVARILSDSLPEAIERTHRVAARLVSVDGVLHETACPPAWSVNQVTVDQRPLIRVELVMHAYPGSVAETGGASMAQLFSIGRRDEALACADAMAELLGLERAPDAAPVEVIDPDACAIDDVGTSAAHALQSALRHVGSPDFPYLSDAVLVAFMAVRHAARVSEIALVHDAGSARLLLGNLADALEAHPEDVPGASGDLPALVAYMRRLTKPFAMRFDRYEEAYRASVEEDLEAVEGAFAP